MASFFWNRQENKICGRPDARVHVEKFPQVQSRVTLNRADDKNFLHALHAFEIFLTAHAHAFKAEKKSGDRKYSQRKESGIFNE